jgi:hypothetical protein
VFLRRDQLIPVKKAVNEKEQLEKGLEEEEEKNSNYGVRFQLASSNGLSTSTFPFRSAPAELT